MEETGRGIQRGGRTKNKERKTRLLYALPESTVVARGVMERKEEDLKGRSALSGGFVNSQTGPRESKAQENPSLWVNRYLPFEKWSPSYLLCIPLLSAS